MFDRDTMRKLSEEKAIIFAQEFSEATAVKVEPASISPGIVPERSGGKKAKCFFLYLKFHRSDVNGFWRVNLKWCISCFAVIQVLSGHVDLPRSIQETNTAISCSSPT